MNDTNFKIDRHTNVPASYIVLFRDKKTLLLRRFNTGFEDGNYSLASGHVELGENFTDCVIREAKEEIGIELEKEDLEVLHVMHRKSTGVGPISERVDVFFGAKKWQNEPQILEKDKCDELIWADVNNLPANTIPYIKKAFENISNGIFYSEFGW